jgi:hypothetical protein
MRDKALPAGGVELLVKDHLLFKCADRSAYHLAQIGKNIRLSADTEFSAKVSRRPSPERRSELSSPK